VNSWRTRNISPREKEAFQLFTTNFLFPQTNLGDRTFCRKTFYRKTFCRRTLCRTNILSNGQFDERAFRRKGILPKRQLAENREILGVVTRTAYDWLLNKTSQSYNQFINMMTETLVVK